MSFPQDSLCLSGVSLSRQRHDILDFSICPLSRVLLVTLASWQGFGFEFLLRSSPCTFSESMDIGGSADYFVACYTADEGKKARNSCPRLQFLAFSLDSIMPLPRLAFLRSISLASLSDMSYVLSF